MKTSLFSDPQFKERELVLKQKSDYCLLNLSLVLDSECE